MEDTVKEVVQKPEDCGCGVTRRQVMVGAAVGSAALAASGLLGKKAQAGGMTGAKMDGYPKTLIGKVSELATDEPKIFSYPQDNPESIMRSILVKIGIPAAAGVGPEGDIVAYNSRCPHQGGELADEELIRYDAPTKTLGPCPWHLSTFDAANEGILTSAHSTQNLPQVVLEVEGDNIFAVGMKGLIYGMPDNLMIVS